MYLRMLDQEDEFGIVDYDLTASQNQKISKTGAILATKSN